MRYVWGGLIVAVGVFLFVCATTKSNFAVYRWLVARSRVLWKDNVYLFHQISGAAVTVFGILVALGAIRSGGN
jgi:hypothetical protein